jgi:hypothetical protein
MPAGRPTALTLEILAEVRRMLPVTLYLETIAHFVGVSRLSFRNCLRREKNEEKRLRKAGAQPRAAEAIFLEFLNVYKQALAESEFLATAVIKNGDRPRVAGRRLAL